MPKPDDTELTPDQELAQTRKEILEDGVWCVYDRGAFRDEDDDLDDGDRDEFEELEIVLSPYSNFMRTPICRVEQTGPIGREIASQICASNLMRQVLREVKDYFDTHCPPVSGILKSRVNLALREAKHPIT